jgi:tRNA pseudouridine55 synthase
VNTTSNPKLNIYLEGKVLLVNKPLHWTSFDVVRKIHHLTKAKTGHAGTLDPLATGLLICCTGKMTKNIREYQSMIKEYTGSFTLGATTSTYDLESEPENFQSVEYITEEDIHRIAHEFTGGQWQFPPAHSAIKQNGKPVYKMARKGIEVKMEPRKIIIYEMDITHINLPVVYFKVVCSTGTYIRSLAHDFGKAIGCGAYLSELCRTKIGDYRVEDAKSISEWEAIIKNKTFL